jgi:hypothetical protein
MQRILKKKILKLCCKIFWVKVLESTVVGFEQWSIMKPKPVSKQLTFKWATFYVVRLVIFLNCHIQDVPKNTSP